MRPDQHPWNQDSATAATAAANCTTHFLYMASKRSFMLSGAGGIKYLLESPDPCG